MASKAKENDENEEILKTLIKSYENLEEKLENINGNIDKLKSELQVSGGFGKEKKKEQNFENKTVLPDNFDLNLIILFHGYIIFAFI